ncbi:hypothetical protein [Lysinibacillus capsici]|uniref:hypothetical protein n=1 Tax=Lysinibacillus capsici TaxID=2115968 RepID=UPI003081453D|nr:hypothetical protein ICJ70_21765 [Lysinibacillus capsici]
MSKNVDFTENYAFTAKTIGDMLVMKVIHKLTGVVIYTKRKKILNKTHLRSELYTFREYLFERNGLEQIILDNLTRSHGIDTESKDLNLILDEVSVAQNNKGYFEVTNNEVQTMEEEVKKGEQLDDLLKQMEKKKSKINFGNGLK